MKAPFSPPAAPCDRRPAGQQKEMRLVPGVTDLQEAVTNCPPATHRRVPGVLGDRQQEFPEFHSLRLLFYHTKGVSLF